MILRLLATSFLRAAPPALGQRTHFIRSQRPFSNTTRTLNIENFSAFSAAFQNTTTFKKLADHPEALNAIRAMMDTLQESGIDVTSGAQPSTFKMAKLMMNSKFREQVKLMNEEMNKAGIDLGSKEVMEELLALKKAAESK